MEWQESMPTETGYYWYTDDKYLAYGRDPDIFWIAPSLSIKGSAVIYLTFPKLDIRRLEHMGLKWKIAGPIETPTEGDNYGSDSQTQCR